jgi:hypothetical protein
MVPIAMEELVGDTAIESKVGVASETVSVVDPETDPKVAVMVVVPGPTADARPEELIAATLVAEELHVAVERCRVLPSLKVPIAENCWFEPDANVGLGGVTSIETSVAGVTMRLVEPRIE